jgi:prophage regulatory protein
MSARKDRVRERPMPARLAYSQDQNEPGLEPKGPSRANPIRLLRLTQVIEATGLGKTKIYELQSQGRFPMRVHITAHTVGWVEEEIQAWLTRRIAARPGLSEISAAPRGLR